jgi:hypothetical protein
MRTFTVLVLIFLMSACNADYALSYLQEETITYKDSEFGLLNEASIAFEKDTIKVNLWYRTFNVDGDNERIISLTKGKKRKVIPLNDSVNNYNNLSAFTLKKGTRKLLWLEDNFGSTVIDLNKQKIVFNIKKELTERTPTGAPIGVLNPPTLKNMAQKLGIKNSSSIVIEKVALY